MAAWPELDELKQVLDVTSDVWDGDDDETRLTALLAAAIEYVKQDSGQDTETPSDSLGRAALRLACLMAMNPEVAASVTGRGLASFVSDPAYNAFMFGERRAFGIG